MQMSGVFDYTIDLGDIGEVACTVDWSGYRPARIAEDDYPEMTIDKVMINICGQSVDVVDLLTSSAQEVLMDQAWSNFPTREDLAAEAADNWMQERADREIGA
jgi:hypothetical protein